MSAHAPAGYSGRHAAAGRILYAALTVHGFTQRHRRILIPAIAALVALTIAVAVAAVVGAVFAWIASNVAAVVGFGAVVLAAAAAVVWSKS